MIFIWAASGAGYFWPIWVIGPWGVMMLPSLLVGRLAPRPRRQAYRAALRAQRRADRTSWY
jgi:hypothetical protein